MRISNLSDLCYCSSPCDCGVTVIDMYHHQHWQIMESYASFMSPAWCWVWLMIQSIHCICIWSEPAPSHNALLSWLKPSLAELCTCSDGLKPTYTQFSNPSFSEPTWTVSMLLWDKLCLMEFTKNTNHWPTASHVDYKFGCENLLAELHVCSIKKFY